MIGAKHILFLLVVVFGLIFTACNSPKNSPPENIGATENVSSINMKVVNVDDATGCINYLKGKNFYGGNVRLEFTYDGNAAVYNKQTNELVFTGYVEVGERYGNASRRIKVGATTGSEVLKLMLSEDGNLMDETDATMYKTTP